MKIALSQGLFAEVDDADYADLMQFKWSAVRMHRRFYAVRTYTTEGGKRISELMHRRIMGNPEGLQIDHINREGLDNRRANLRVATIQQNRCNVGSKAGSTSKYIGVTWVKSRNKWQAQIRINGRQTMIGRFDTQEAAARAYDAAAIVTHGEFASPNFAHEARA